MNKIFVLLLLTAAVWAKADSRAVPGAGFSLTTDGTGVFIAEPGGREVFRLGNLSLQWAPQDTRITGVEKVDDATWRADYQFTEDPERRFSGYALFRADGAKITADYHITVPEGVDTGGATMERWPLTGERDDKLYKSGIWRRHRHGGVPVEHQGAVLRGYHTGAISIWEHVLGNPDWSYPFQQHVVFVPDEDDPQSRRARAEFMVTPAGVDPGMAAALFNGEPLAIGLEGMPDHHIRHESAAPAEFRVVVGNPGRAAEDVTVRLKITDFNGRELFDRSVPVSVEAGGRYRLPVALELPEGQNIYFIEAAADGARGEVFLRSTLAVFTPHQFTRSADSIFGMAGYFPVPSEESALALLRELGVAHLRHGDNRYYGRYGFFADYHTHYNPEEWQGKSEAELVAQIDALIAGVRDFGARRWEFGNENHFSRLEEAAAYVEVLRKLRSRLEVLAPGVELLSIGFANGFGGVESLRLVHQAGGWPLLDGIAYHLGRGNTTPDLDDGRDGWFYLNSLRALQALLREYGDKPVYLTEIYTPTYPNSWWDDSQRRAAENVALAYAVALAEGVKIAYYYQLHDSVWFDIGGINTGDREYSFGMLDRQGAPKPVALAYRQTARMLENARFIRPLALPGGTAKGYLFALPEGEAALLWDRSEGYVQSVRSDDYADPEPWVSHWTTSVPLRLPAAGPVILYDAIGQKTTATPENGGIEVALTGAPVWVVGADFTGI